MTDEKKRTTTIELTAQDQRCIQAIAQRWGITNNIGAIRYALRVAVERDPTTMKIHDALSSPGASAMEVAQAVNGKENQ